MVGTSLSSSRFVSAVGNQTKSVLRYISYISHRSSHATLSCLTNHSLHSRVGLRQSIIMVIKEDSKEHSKESSKESSPPRAGKVLLTGK